MGRATFRKIITTPEKLDEVNPKNKTLQKQFLKNKSITCSETTITGYESDLNIFFVYCLDYLDNKFFVDIKKLEMSEFFSYCTEELQWGSSRLNRMRSALSSLSQFIERFMDDDYPDFRNIVLKVIDSAPKSEKREKTVLSDDKVDWLLQYLSETDKQKACWLALAVASGARFSELLRFEVSLIDENNRAFDDIFLETTRQIRTKGRGKTGKLLHKFIIAEIFLPHFKEWLPERKKIMEENNEDHDYLFIKRNGKPAVDGTIRSWVNSIDKLIEEDFYAHALRHYLTTYLSKKGLPARLIRDLFGWSSIDLVEIYDDSTSKDKNWEELKALKKDLK